MIFNCALLVDDSRSARFALRKLLERNGIQVDVADNATQALEFLNDRHPDIIFMDHFMPGMDGFEAARIIRNGPATADIPIVMCTSNEGDEYFQEAKANGANAMLTKPATAPKLLQVLDELREISMDLGEVKVGESGLAVSHHQDIQTQSSDEQWEAKIVQVLDARLPQFREAVTSGLDMIIKPLLQRHVEKAMTQMRHEFDSLVELRCREIVESTSRETLQSMVAQRSAQMREQIESEFSEQIADVYSGIGELRANQSLRKATPELIQTLEEQAIQTARDEATKVLADVRKLAHQSAQDESKTLFSAAKKELVEQCNHKLSVAVDATTQLAKQAASQVSWEKMQQVDERIKQRLGSLFFVSGVALFAAAAAISGMVYLLLS